MKVASAEYEDLVGAAATIWAVTLLSTVARAPEDRWLLAPLLAPLEAELLLAIAKRGSLSAAGRDIGLTQQAVSARMASLEARREYGCWCGPPAVRS